MPNRAHADAVLLLYAESAVHWGAGSAIGAVDLPIQRERHTGYPCGQGSGLKGSLRDFLSGRPGISERHITAIFGPDTNAGDKHAGCVLIGDASLLLFPIRSLRGTFAYATSRLALARFQRHTRLFEKIPPEPQDGTALVAPNGALVLKNHNAVVLEEVRFSAAVDQVLGSIAAKIREWAQGSLLADRIGTHIVLLPETDFASFTRSSTIFETHVRIDDKSHTAEEGGLFTAEFLPPDTLMYCPLTCLPPFVKDPPEELKTPQGVRQYLSEQLNKKQFQTGADATTGRGLMRIFFREVDHANGQ
jgi:CRISPR-associated protein Cmr4